MSQVRMELKCPSGWFAAGREVRLAATLLSDSAFKLFVWISLHAERNSGRLPLMINELARSLRKTEREIDRCVRELVTAGVCRLNASDCIEIQERFWPYRRDFRHVETADSAAYVAGIRRLFLGHGCISCSFSPADERLAISWWRRGVSLEHAGHAICLGVARKYAALLNNGKGSPITALSYFEHLITEVAHAEVSPNYWRHVKDRAEQFERRWQTAPRPQSAAIEETK